MGPRLRQGDGFSEVSVIGFTLHGADRILAPIDSATRYLSEATSLGAIPSISAQSRLDLALRPDLAALAHSALASPIGFGLAHADSPLASWTGGVGTGARDRSSPGAASAGDCDRLIACPVVTDRPPGGRSGARPAGNATIGRSQELRGWRPVRVYGGEGTPHGMRQRTRRLRAARLFLAWSLFRPSAASYSSDPRTRAGTRAASGRKRVSG